MYARMSVSFRSPTRKTITFACFNHDETCIVRREFFKPRKNLRRDMNLSGYYRMLTLAKIHLQADPLSDPFLVSVLIMLAQQKRLRTPKPEPRSLSFPVGYAP